MSDDPFETSREVATRLRAFRTTRGLTGEQMAELLTNHGYPITRSVLANIENMRFRTLPVDLMFAAVRALDLQGTGHFFVGHLCNGCSDNPPVAYICKVCSRTRNADGELVRC